MNDVIDVGWCTDCGEPRSVCLSLGQCELGQEAKRIETDRKAMVKRNYANKCFGLPVEQIRYYEELTNAEKVEAAEIFGRVGREMFVYAVKKTGGVVPMRERRRPEWGD